MTTPPLSSNNSATKTPPPKRVVPTITGYTLLRRLGMGGMGGVFLARQESVDREVAVKILAPRLAQDQQFVERFLREARAAANLSHPNLIHVYDCGSSGRWHYFSMEYVAGRTLKQIVNEDGPMPEAVALQHIRAIADALRFAHEKASSTVTSNLRTSSWAMTARSSWPTWDWPSRLQRPMTDRFPDPRQQALLPT